MLAALRVKLEGLDLVSVMAQLRMQTFWERMLVPAFVYFFRLIYPFRLGNDPRTQIGVAAGGCILLRCAALRKIGGFESLRMAIIDDCSLFAVGMAGDPNGKAVFMLACFSQKVYRRF
jgi:hypothetical protein